jgi:uncharacterized protein (DUF2252 family)
LRKISETLSAVAKTSPSAAAVVEIHETDDTILSTQAREDNSKVSSQDKSSSQSSVKSSTDNRDSAQIQAQLKSAQDLLGQAKAKFRDGEYDSAAQLGHKALETARDAQAHSKQKESDRSLNNKGSQKINENVKLPLDH